MTLISLTSIKPPEGTTAGRARDPSAGSTLRFAGFERVQIVGSPGTGKSTLAFALASSLRLPICHLDQIHWRPGWVMAPRDQTDPILQQRIGDPKWIMDGNYFGHRLKERVQRATDIIWLDYPTHIAMRRVLHRIRTTRGRVRPDMADGCPEQLDLEFIRYTLEFRRRRRPELEALVADLGTAQTLWHFTHPSACDAFVSGLDLHPDPGPR